MKLSSPICAVLALALATLSQALDLQLPDRISSLKFVGRTEYDDSRLGYSIRYQNEGLLKADVYVYDKGMANLPEGIDSPQAAKELESVGAAIRQMEQAGKYREVREESPGRKQVEPLKTGLLQVRHRYQQVPAEGVTYTGTRISDTFLLIHQGKFVKIRITTTEEDVKKHQPDMEAFVGEVARQIAQGGQPETEKSSKPGA